MKLKAALHNNVVRIGFPFLAHRNFKNDFHKTLNKIGQEVQPFKRLAVKRLDNRTFNFRLDQRNIEENILTNRSINSENCHISLSEFAKRLKISTTDVSTELLFSLFQKVSIYSPSFSSVLNKTLQCFTGQFRQN